MRYSFLLIVLALLLNSTIGFCQDGNCSEPRIAVKFADFTYPKEMYQHLLFDYEWGEYTQAPEGQWRGIIESLVLTELKLYSPEIVFVPVNGEMPENCDYYIEYILSLIGAGDDIVVPGTDGAVESEYTAYYMTTKFASNPRCRLPGKLFDVEITDYDRNLFSTIQDNVASFGNLGEVIKTHEKTNLVPPRGPKMQVAKTREYVSPLMEHRFLDIEIDVTNCRGEAVFDRDHGQIVFLRPQETVRTDIWPTKRYWQESSIEGQTLALIIVRPHGASGRYKLKKGISSDKEVVKITTCGLDDKVIQEHEIAIYGLEIKVQPNRKEIEAGQRTDIVLTLNEINPDGTEYPVEGKQLEVKISGLENGSIKAKNGYITNSEGKVVLDYKAGNNDEKITVTAIFQPEDYPDKVTARNFIKVKTEEFEARITISKKYNKILHTSKEDSEGEDYKRDINESIEASATIYLALTNTMDMPIFNQTWQYYTPTKVNLSEFNYSFKESQFRSGPKFETNVDNKRSANNYEIEGQEYVSQLPWILVIDNETKKAVKLIPAGYSIGYEINEVENINSVVYSDNGPKRDSKTTTKTGSKSFKLGPVGEEVDDPTIKKSDNWMQDYLKKQGIELPAGVDIPKVSNEETVKKIQPDILVKFGDGETNFGGEASNLVNKELDSGFERINNSYNWEMTINKKK